MNRHFQDTRYYLVRAVTTAKKGLTTELEPVVRRVRQRIGREPEPEPDRLESLRADLAARRASVEPEVASAVADARERIRSDRGTGN